MEQFKEIKVKLKGEDSKHQKDFVCYQDNVMLSLEDPTLNDYISQTRAEVKGEFDECEIIVKMVWK